ncbi:fused PTS fructose transporter subunit IIA/HPr protein [Moritella marina ATCC 15381]|uniref:Fused PTS fructose transporter subunit IIA/HPr protein n=1 Tax=Moritella marina ATCC 15381 TaxID=1202962 RepID=A0A5J6WI69_MORMI|nr:fused PTS fructose transporter subunit IIA/HPr protein [Moritella marina]QFI36880.1 fused PTS fructose transporter subunit IIA/HPr protein [Moritella marina ATCC 15381]
MLSLSSNDIQLKQSAPNKLHAIKALAQSLANKTYVEASYVDGMLAREAQHSTYLGNGIAIPHGTVDTRDLVNKTGVQLHHFPQGVDWGEGQTVYLAIAIAAKSDEHLAILKQLTHVLSDDDIELKLQQCDSAEAIIALLEGNKPEGKSLEGKQQSATLLTADLIQLNFPAQDLSQLTAVAAGLLKHHGCIDNSGVADAITTPACHLGQGLWLAKTSKAVTTTAIAFVTPAQSLLQGSLQQSNLPQKSLAVKGVLMLASANNLHLDNMQCVVDLIYKQQVNQLFNADADTVIRLLTAVQPSGITATFTIHNSHGLHARPSAMLVKITKQYQADIQVTNAAGKSTNAKNLMKLMSLGVCSGEVLTFTANGHDAQVALKAIGEGIESGLGEGK